MGKKEEHLVKLIKAIQEEYGEGYYMYAIPGFLARNFMAYCSMKQDLELILKYIDELVDENHSEVLKSALTYGLISLYGKCYTDASKHKSAKLESKNIFKDEEKHLDTHNDLMNMRHHFIAHRGDTHHEVTVAYMLVAMTGNEKNQIRFKRLKQAGLTGEDLLKIKELCLFILKYLISKIQQSGEKVHKALFEIFTPEQITQMLMNNAK